MPECPCCPVCGSDQTEPRRPGCVNLIWCWKCDAYRDIAYWQRRYQAKEQAERLAMIDDRGGM